MLSELFIKNIIYGIFINKYNQIIVIYEKISQMYSIRF